MHKTIDLSLQSFTNFNAVVIKPSLSDVAVAATTSINNTQNCFIFCYRFGKLYFTINKHLIFFFFSNFLVRKNPVNCDFEDSVARVLFNLWSLVELW